MKPTVSESRKAGFNDYFSNCGIQSGEKLVFDKTSLFPMAFIKVDFPH
jgi:hypothetical protein